MGKIKYFDYEKEADVEITSPSAQDLRHCINALGKGKNTFLGISMQLGFLGILEASEGRVRVTFDGDEGEGILLDLSYPRGSREIKLVGDPEVETIPIRITVTKEKAYEVGIYFLENGKIPKELSWTGTLGKISDQD